MKKMADPISFAKQATNEAMRKCSFANAALSQTGMAFSGSSQKIGQEWVCWFMASAEKSRDGLMSLMTCGSPKEYFDLQNRLLREHVELLISSGQKILDINKNVSNIATSNALAVKENSTQTG
jgi:hypothetical protein